MIFGISLIAALIGFGITAVAGSFIDPNPYVRDPIAASVGAIAGFVTFCVGIVGVAVSIAIFAADYLP